MDKIKIKMSNIFLAPCIDITLRKKGEKIVAEEEPASKLVSNINRYKPKQK